MMLPLTLYGLLLGLASAAVKYDQAQTGDYNVHLDLKNIEVLAFLDGSSLGLGDYEYDYGEYTVKPPPNATNGHGGPQNAGTSSSTAPSSVSPLDGNSTSATETNSTELNSIKELDTNSTESNVVIESTTKPPRRCGAGFYRDPAGRCRRLRRPIKLV
ncbi:uncharacterized protein [Halyomorpha halys]|uniref:uncharacterized protein isoform X2 n=1 Tax=Halyomorpha halys TaxID=286706 RepID=UPI0006D525B2|nr:uncharacterized protein LOC106681476 isoform X2 [Halyomorpha halys]